MRMISILSATALIALAVPTAQAITLDRPQPGAGSSQAMSDPDEHLERLAAASTPADGGRGRPAGSIRNIMRSDPYLQRAFAWLDNR